MELSPTAKAGDREAGSAPRSRSVRERCRALAAVAVGGVVAAVLAAPTGAAAATTPPQTELIQATSQLDSLVATADPSAQADLTGAVSQLKAATASYLWSDPADALPPPAGDRVFVDSAAAADELARIGPDPTVSRSALAGAVHEIAAAGSYLAVTALARAGLDRGFPPPGSLSVDQSLYDHAFALLGTEISTAVTSIPRQAVERSAESFLDSPNRFAGRPEALSGAPLMLNGKPELFYYGAGFCPFCAVTRWSMVLALAQFGDLSPLALGESTPIDFAPSTNTFSFYGSQYASPYLAFAPVEAVSNELCLSECNGSEWTTLQTPDEAEQQILNEHNPQLHFPFLDFGNLWHEAAVVEPLLLHGMSWEQIAASVANPNSTVGQYLDGAAELFAAQICQITGGRPQWVCQTSVNRQYQQLLSAPSAAVDGTNELLGVSCPSTSLCAAVDVAGNVLITRNPTAASPTWSAPDDIDGATALTSVACPSTSLCMAVNGAGDALVTHDASAAEPAWSAPDDIDATNSFVYVRCPSISLCVAVDDAGNVLETDDPAAATPTWSAPTNIDGSHLLVLSCPSASLCVAADQAGNVLSTEDPGAATPNWSAAQSIDPQSGFDDISCPSTSLCVAVDFSGNAFVTNDPSAATPTWTSTHIDSNALFAVSCASASLCVAGDGQGNVLISDDPSSPTPTWTDTSIDPTAALLDVSCPSTALCVVVDSDGVALETDDPTAAAPTWNPPAKFLH
jgi:hypothetical protein